MSDFNYNKIRFPLFGYLLLVGSAFFTSLSYVIGKIMDKDLDPESTAFFWFFGAFIFSLFVSPFIPSQRKEIRNLRSYGNIFIYTSVLTSAGASLWMFSLWTIGPALTSFLLKTQTLFSLVLGMLFLGERLNKWESLGIVVTIAGGIIVAYQKDSYLMIGTVTAISAALLYSLVSFLVKKIANDLNMLTVATLRTLGVSIVLFAYLILTGTFDAPDFADIVFMGLGGVSGACIAKACQFHSIKMLDVSRTTAILPLESLFVVILSYFIFNDLPSIWKMFGGILIITGVVFLVFFRDGNANLFGK